MLSGVAERLTSFVLLTLLSLILLALDCDVRTVLDGLMLRHKW